MLQLFKYVISAKKIIFAFMKVYFVTGIDILDESFVKKCTAFFPQWRKEQMLRFKHLKGQIQNGLAYILLLHALREEGILNKLPEFSYNEYNKPFMINYPGWHFNFSHSKTTVACVLSKNVVGIDIQDVGVYKDSLVAYSCNDKEMNLIRQSENPVDDFCRIWTMKEAVFKYFGTGIITDTLKNILENENVAVESKKIGIVWLSIAYGR